MGGRSFSVFYWAKGTLRFGRYKTLRGCLFSSRMADAMFSSFQFSDVQGAGYCHLSRYGAKEVVAEDKQNRWFQMDHESDEANALCSISSLYDQQDSSANLFPSSQQTTAQLLVQNDSQNKMMPQRLQPIYDSTRSEDIHPQPSKVGKPLKEKPYSFSLASLEILSNYGKALKSVMDENESANPITENIRGQKLSLGEIIRVAGERYIQFSAQKVDGLSMFIHPYNSELSNLSIEEAADVELVQHLLAAAECVGHQQFDIASALITRCHWIASDTGNAVQRIVFHFAEALQQRIEIETGRSSLERINERAAYQRKLEVDFNVSFLACHQELPFSQTFQFAAVQAIVENIKTASKIHLIDLHIRSGIQWTVLMQALAERDDCPALKISALKMADQQHLEDTGKRLQSFAQSMNIPFSFRIVCVSDMKELSEDIFKKEPDEAVAVYSPLILRTMISSPDILGSLMRAIRQLKPSVLVVIEVEANHNSPNFVSRFIESLFYYSAFFDCLEDCMERDSPHRRTVEGVYLGEGIRNMVGTEGDKRCSRNVKIDVWREFFARFEMAEIELSESSLRQANMVLKKFPKANSCTLINHGKGVVIAWKGTPIHSLTTWKFQ